MEAKTGRLAPRRPADARSGERNRCAAGQPGSGSGMRAAFQRFDGKLEKGSVQRQLFVWKRKSVFARDNGRRFAAVNGRRESLHRQSRGQRERRNADSSGRSGINEKRADPCGPRRRRDRSRGRGGNAGCKNGKKHRPQGRAKQPDRAAAPLQLLFPSSPYPKNKHRHPLLSPENKLRNPMFFCSMNRGFRSYAGRAAPVQPIVQGRLRFRREASTEGAAAVFSFPLLLLLFRS